MTNRWKPIAKYPKFRRAIETETEIIFEAHEGVASVDEDRYAKPEHYLHVADWYNADDAWHIVFQDTQGAANA